MKDNNRKRKKHLDLPQLEVDIGLYSAAVITEELKKKGFEELWRREIVKGGEDRSFVTCDVQVVRGGVRERKKAAS